MIDKETFEKHVKSSRTIREVLMKLGKNESSNSYKTFRNMLIQYGINTNHFLTKSEAAKEQVVLGKMKRLSDEEIFCENSTASRTTAKSRILEKRLLKYQCEMCHMSDIWQKKRITLILDHKNGVRNDHRKANLRFLCPNCNATLETHCLGSDGLKRKLEAIQQKEKPKHRRYSPRFSTRKVAARPSKEELSKLLLTHSYSSLGREYSISDTAIRKWAKTYGLLR